MSQEEQPSASAYKHAQPSVQRPDAGVEAQFTHRKAPKTYRYDSSLAPELCWDENGERPFAEWLLNLIVEAAEKGEAEIFAEPQVWRRSDGHAALCPSYRWGGIFERVLNAAEAALWKGAEIEVLRWAA